MEPRMTTVWTKTSLCSGSARQRPRKLHSGRKVLQACMTHPWQIFFTKSAFFTHSFSICTFGPSHQHIWLRASAAMLVSNFVCMSRVSSTCWSRSWASCFGHWCPSSCGTSTSWERTPQTVTSWEPHSSSSTASARYLVPGSIISGLWWFLYLTFRCWWDLIQKTL